MLVLEQNNLKKKLFNKKVLDLKFNIGKSKNENIKVIHKDVFYASMLKAYPLGFYYIITSKNYLLA